MARGFVYALYTADDGALYAKQVDIDQAADPARGWKPMGAVVGAFWPMRAKPRMVFGVSPTTGRRGHTIVADVQADLWTGVATAFGVETNDPDVPTDLIKVTRRVGESFPVTHQIVQPGLPAQP